jgi:hypothetical protein
MKHRPPAARRDTTSGIRRACPRLHGPTKCRLQQDQSIRRSRASRNRPADRLRLLIPWDRGNRPIGGLVATWISDMAPAFLLDHRTLLSELWEKSMIRWIVVAAVASVVATSAHAMSPAPLPQFDSMITQVATGCGIGRTRVGGVCVARTTKRQVRRCAVWGAGKVCRRWS